MDARDRVLISGHFYAEENIGCFISWLRSIGIRAPLSISLIMASLFLFFFTFFLHSIV